MNNRDNHQLPPGQQLVAPGKWPIVGERTPAAIADPWTISVSGTVRKPRVWTLDEIQAMPRQRATVDIHCVTRWSKLGVEFMGVALTQLLDLSGIEPATSFVSFIAASDRQHSTSIPLRDAQRLNVLLALETADGPLPTIHGGPIRVVVPGRYFYKSLKWLARIELLSHDKLGYWEADAGYHNDADPWLEQRYIASSISKQQAERLIASRNFQGENLLGLDVSQRDLTTLDATTAILRNAVFRGCDLTDARFDEANLSNAHFEGAILSGASFEGADCEGASFSGADLRGADFTDASLLAATFAPDAVIDTSTRISQEQIDTLLPVDAQIVAERLG